MTAKRRKPFPGLSHRNARAQRAFLVAYARTGIITRAAQAAKVDRRTHTNWLEFPGQPGDDYRAAFAQAQEMAADVLEEEARRRAVKGLVRFKFTKDGDPILHPKTRKPYYELEYSDTLLLAQLKANRPEKYREREAAVEVTINLAERLRAARKRLTDGSAS